MTRVGRETSTSPKTMSRQEIDLSLLEGLRDKIPNSHPPFDIDKFGEEGYDPALRD